MKAYLLAAGVGSRLRPLTDHTPKCLVPFKGVPLLGIWLELMRRAGITDVLINTHHLPQAVRAFVKADPVPGVRVTLFHEETLIGSAGTVWANRDFVRGEPDFLVVYADNLTDMDLGGLIRFHRAKDAFFTMGLFEAEYPEQCGIAEVDADGRVLSFVEKPAKPKGRLANGGLYVANQGLFDVTPQRDFLDFGFDVLPLLAGRMFGYPIRSFYTDIGTPERLEKAQREWPGLGTTC